MKIGLEIPDLLQEVKCYQCKRTIYSGNKKFIVNSNLLCEKCGTSCSSCGKDMSMRSSYRCYNPNCKGWICEDCLVFSSYDCAFHRNCLNQCVQCSNCKGVILKNDTKTIKNKTYCFCCIYWCHGCHQEHVSSSPKACEKCWELFCKKHLIVLKYGTPINRQLFAIGIGGNRNTSICLECLTQELNCNYITKIDNVWYAEYKGRNNGAYCEEIQ